MSAQQLTDCTNKNKLAFFRNKFDISHHYSLMEEKRQNFLEKIKCYGTVLKRNVQTNKVIKLSQREYECIYLLSMGNTAKETVRILQLSHRTIESYINNIKLKTGFKFKSQLVQLIK